MDSGTDEARTEQAPPVITPADRVKAAIETLNKSIGADVHDRLHAQTNAINAIADALFSGGQG